MIRKRVRFASTLMLLVTVFNVYAGETTLGQTQTNRPQKKESLARKLLRFAGISASPTTLKGPGDEVTSGQIWLADVASRKTRKLTASGGFRSPIFPQGSNDILALKGADIVRLPAAGGEPRKLSSIGGVLKLVGSSMDDPNQILLVTEDDCGRSGVSLLSVSTGKLAAIPFDPAASEDRELIQHLQAWDRVYGNQSVYVKKQTKQSIAGPAEWTDVFLKVGASDPLNVSQCDEVNCGQPSLSSDGRFVVFIKAGE